MKRQVWQDANVAALAPTSGAVVQRSIAKASANYQNPSWDLVDAAKRKGFKLTEVKTEELPVEMQKMNADERKAYIEKNSQERAKLQKQINQLNAEREKHVVQRMKEAAGANTLDSVVVTSVRKQAQK